MSSEQAALLRELEAIAADASITTANSPQPPPPPPGDRGLSSMAGQGGLPPSSNVAPVVPAGGEYSSAVLSHFNLLVALRVCRGGGVSSIYRSLPSNLISLPFSAYVVNHIALAKRTPSP